METFEWLICSSELQLTQKYKMALNSYLRLWEYDGIAQDRKLEELFEA
jgi:hypothetical protein